jgi:hypothetical protein
LHPNLKGKNSSLQLTTRTLARCDKNTPLLKHDHSNPASVLFVNLVVIIDTASDVLCPPIEEVVVQLSITSPELLLLEEESIIQKRQSVEDIEVELSSI